MSKTVDDLVRVYDDAYNQAYDALAYDVSEEDEQSKRAGIRAVVTALRDYMPGGTAWHLLNGIVYDAGERVADSQRERMQRILDDQLRNQPLPPATDPAPAVCEWEPDNFGRMQHWHPSCTPRVLAAGPDGKGCCYICGKPIKFTEAKT